MNRSARGSTSVNEAINGFQEIVRSNPKIHIVGARTKTGMHGKTDGTFEYKTHHLDGVVAYDPQEFVVTVLAGTKVSTLVEMLACERQYLPFDPLMIESGTTIGGTVASNAAGSGRFRFGGIRDFLLGVRFVDGRGNNIRGGGQVVKNAAGFDYPKLMVGSRGLFGLVYELTFKVFPRPELYATLVSRFVSLDEALNALAKLSVSTFDIESLDLVPSLSSQASFDVAMRIGGIESAISNRIDRIGSVFKLHEVLSGADDLAYWKSVSHFEWAANAEKIVKVSITPKQIPKLEAVFRDSSRSRRYTVGGNVAWVTGKPSDDFKLLYIPSQVFLDRLEESQLQGSRDTGFRRALKLALDPDGKFV